MRFDPTQTILAGIPTATLQQYLADAQAAMAQLMMGRREVTVTYEGKSVTYQPANIALLTHWIYQLQLQLGLVSPNRRALRPYFR